jgi:hypothetical protein
MDPTGENAFDSKDAINYPRLELIYESTLENNLPPEIGDVSNSPIIPTSENDVLISTQINDNDSIIESVMLFYRVNNGEWQITQMTNNGSAYIGMIPQLNSGSLIEYYVLSKDEHGNNSTSTIQQYQVDRPEYFHTLQMEYDTLKMRFDELMRDFESIQLNADLILVNYDLLLGNYTDIMSRYETLQNDYSDLSNIFNSLEDDFKLLQNDYEQIDFRLLNAIESAGNLQQIMTELQTKLENVEAELALSEGVILGDIDQINWLQSELNITRIELSEVLSEFNFTETSDPSSDSSLINMRRSLAIWQIAGVISLCSSVILLYYLYHKNQKR